MKIEEAKILYQSYIIMLKERKDDDLKPLIVGGKMILDYVAQLENENAKLKRKNLFKAMTDEKIGEIINEKR